MTTSGVYSLSRPDISGALRYERIAQLEAVLKLKEKRQRTRLVLSATLILSLTTLSMLAIFM